MTQPGVIARNVANVRGLIRQAAQRARREAESIRLIAITKTFPAETVRAGFAAGLREFGENRVQEFQQKQEILNPAATMPGAQFHLIGHLQSNKAAGALAFDWIQTLDSRRLALRLNELAGRAGKKPQVLIQIKLGEELAQEDRKTGAAPAEAIRLAELLSQLDHLDPRGLMLIPPCMENPEAARQYFRQLREIRSRLQADGHGWARELSMGMSHDFPIAIEEGATMVRVGTALFGPRQRPPEQVSSEVER